MVNFHILVLPVSGHLLGGVLAGVMLGPWAGACVIATVLVVQCLLCGDGGLTAAWFSVILGSGAFAVELAASGHRDDFFNVLGWMVLIHAAIGLGEATITGLVVRFVLQVRPDLIHDADETAPRAIRFGQVGFAGLGIALAVAIFLAPLASEFPDGLEAVGMKLGFINEAQAPPPIVPAPIRDYAMPGLRWKPAATAAAGTVGTVLVFGVGLALARAFTAGKGPALGVAPDAA
jgi:cobalt/nickel transport system permease protein